MADQLPTPSVSPEPDDVVLVLDEGHLLDTENATAPQNLGEEKADIQLVSFVAPRSRRPSLGEEAAVSDASEKTRHVQIKRPGDGRRKSSVSEHDKLLRLSPKQIHDLTNEPASIPVRTATPIPEDVLEGDKPEVQADSTTNSKGLGVTLEPPIELGEASERRSSSRSRVVSQEKEIVIVKGAASQLNVNRPSLGARSTTTPPIIRRKYSGQK